ncbi:hypothetical protein [Streptomyces sp. NPDC054829]
MSRCLACGQVVPDLPSPLPHKYCSARCRDRVADAVARFLDAIGAPETDTPTEEGAASDPV